MTTTTTNPTVTLARGDGIGPEISDAVMRILDAAGAKLHYEEIDIGERQYLSGHTSGIAPDAWDVIRRNPAFLKGPITTPLGGGYKSLNVTIRKSLNLFANVRRSRSYAPFVSNAAPGMDVVVVRENEEDLYAGIEHQQTQEVAQVLKLVSRPGSERIVRYAFEYARAHGRKHVTCMTKSNIMKHTDGLFAEVFREIAEEYPDIGQAHQVIDIGAARVATRPQDFDVIVTLNLYGDILSDIASEVSGSVGIAGSINVGEKVSMFEAVHGSAPDIAGQGVANPSGLLLAAVDMLLHLDQSDVATRVKNAWLSTLEDGVHTSDLVGESTNLVVGTQPFADAVIERMGNAPKTLPDEQLRPHRFSVQRSTTRRRRKALVGVDVFVDWDEHERAPHVLADHLAAAGEGWRLKMITNRGVQVWPNFMPETFCTDHWRCRFMANDEHAAPRDVVELLSRLGAGGLDVIKTENLYNFDDERGFSLGQGE